VPRAAGIDLGSVRVGLAVADELGILAHPRPHLDGRDLVRLVAILAKLAADEGIDTFVVGLPRHMDGRESRGARRARELGDKLRQKGLEVELVDERLTTVEATGRLREAGVDSRASRSRVDSAAAAILLQAWLDARRGSDA
jgi:putative Holliday junction resolvase